MYKYILAIVLSAMLAAAALAGGYFEKTAVIASSAVEFTVPEGMIAMTFWFPQTGTYTVSAANQDAPTTYIALKVGTGAGTAVTFTATGAMAVSADTAWLGGAKYIKIAVTDNVASCNGNSVVMRGVTK